MSNQKKIKTAFLRFYEELNDFLPSEKRKKKFSHKFKDNPSVKDMIESLGIPHTEVDLILVDNNSVDFSYLVQDKNEISVYPIFESFNIKKINKLRPIPLRETKFVLDVHLGKLARFLRMFGFDTTYKNNFCPREILKISKSEKKIILTKSRELLKIKDVTHGFCLQVSNPEKQLVQVLKRFNLFDDITPFSRCLICNEKLKSIQKEKILDKIPTNVKKWKQKFHICPKCKKIYWKGSHHENMKKFIEKIKKLEE